MSLDNDRPSKNGLVLADFTAYCQLHPEYRFWQALRNWAGVKFVFVRTEGDHMEGNLLDTFYREWKNA